MPRGGDGYFGSRVRGRGGHRQNGYGQKRLLAAAAQSRRGAGSHVAVRAILFVGGPMKA